MELSAGAVIAQHYVLERLLGEGGMGAVWSAQHQRSHAWVALKFLKEPGQPELVRRFVREARAANSVRHPNVIRIHDITLLDDGLPVMIMDLLEGESLAARLQRTGSIPVQELASIMVPILSAVGAAHALGIVHRDLKPDNIFLALRDGRVHPTVLDFGICKLTSPEAVLSDESTLTATGSVMGTPLYMAPEQIFGEPDVDARADVWALGAILYQCSTGKCPVEGENVGQLIKHIVAGTIKPLQELAPHVPPEFARVVHRMLTHDRLQRALDLREAFDTLSALTEVSAQSFGAATTLLLLAPSVPPGSPDTPVAAAGIAAANAAPADTTAGKALAAGIAARPKLRHSRLVAGGAVMAALALAVLAPSILGRGATYPTPPPSALPAGATALPSPLIPTTSSAPAVASAVAEPAPSSSASASRVRPSPGSSTTAPAKRATPLAGGVHATVPF